MPDYRAFEFFFRKKSHGGWRDFPRQRPKRRSGGRWSRVGAVGATRPRCPRAFRSPLVAFSRAGALPDET